MIDLFIGMSTIIQKIKWAKPRNISTASSANVLDRSSTTELLLRTPIQLRGYLLRKNLSKKCQQYLGKNTKRSSFQNKVEWEILYFNKWCPRSTRQQIRNLCKVIELNTWLSRNDWLRKNSKIWSVQQSMLTSTNRSLERLPRSAPKQSKVWRIFLHCVIDGLKGWSRTMKKCWDRLFARGRERSSTDLNLCLYQATSYYHWFIAYLRSISYMLLEWTRNSSNLSFSYCSY